MIILYDRFKKYKNVSQLVKAIKKETALNPDAETVNALIEFLITHSLVYATANESIDHFENNLNEG